MLPKWRGRYRWDLVEHPRVRPERACVYAIRESVTGGFYIGSTIDVERRQANYRFDLQHGCATPLLQAAWDAYGPDVWVWIDLWYVARCEELAAYEDAFIRYLKPAYNGQRFSGRKGLKSPELRAVRERVLANLLAYGLPEPSEEWKQKHQVTSPA